MMANDMFKICGRKQRKKQQTNSIVTNVRTNYNDQYINWEKEIFKLTIRSLGNNLKTSAKVTIMVQGAKARVPHFFWPFGTFLCHCRSNNKAAKSSNLSIIIWKTPIPDEKFSISPHSCSKFMTLWLLGKNSEMIDYPPQEKRFRRMQVHFFWLKTSACRLF